MSVESIERKIAAKARELVTPLRDQEMETSYRAWCEGFPIFLRTCGLTQTVAFLKAKSTAKTGEHYKEMYEHLEKQLRGIGVLTEKTLYEKTTDAALPVAEYRMLSEFAMQVGLWHKRFAQALLRTKKEKAA